MPPTHPEIVTLAAETSADAYDNHPVATVNDHVVRISTMTKPYGWHLHPNSDETFIVLEGRVIIDLEDGAIDLGPGQMATVRRGTRHKTRPVGERSVNLTVEHADMDTVFDEKGVGET